MFGNRAKQKNKFDVVVNLVIFTYANGMKIALLRDSKGNYFLPNKKLKKGQGAESAAEEIKNNSCSTAKSSPQLITECGFLSEPDRYKNHSHDISLVFRADLSTTTSFAKGFYFFTEDEISKMYLNNNFSKDHAKMVEIAINGR